VIRGLVDNNVISISKEDGETIKVTVETVADRFMAWSCPYYLAWISYFSVLEIKSHPARIRDFVEKTKREPPDIAFPLDNTIPGYEPETDAIKIENGKYKIFAKKMTLSELLGMLKTLY